MTVPVHIPPFHTYTKPSSVYKLLTQHSHKVDAVPAVNRLRVQFNETVSGKQKKRLSKLRVSDLMWSKFGIADQVTIRAEGGVFSLLPIVSNAPP